MSFFLSSSDTEVERLKHAVETLMITNEEKVLLLLLGLHYLSSLNFMCAFCNISVNVFKIVALSVIKPQNLYNKLEANVSNHFQ